MTITKGLLVSDLVARVLVDISDPNQRRWTSDQVVKFINEGIRELAKREVFKRVDYLVPTANVGYYATLAECRKLLAVEYDFTPLATGTQDNFRDAYGSGWRDDTGTPSAFIPFKEGIQLYPIPTSAGTALTFSGSPDITETQGGKITGDGYSGALNSTTVVHFMQGDGHCTNADTAENNLRIEYAYFPRPSESTDTIPSRYADALVIYATWRTFNLSQVPEEVARSQVLSALWGQELDRLAGENDPAALSSGTRFGCMVAG